jgi:hypothetical protein
VLWTSLSRGNWGWVWCCVACIPPASPTCEYLVFRISSAGRWRRAIFRCWEDFRKAFPLWGKEFGATGMLKED